MLTGFQKGSIFGAVLVGVAFAAALSVIGTQYPKDGNNQSVDRQQKESEGFLDRVFDEPINVFTLGLVVVGAVQAGLFLWQLDLIRKGAADTKLAADAAKESAEVAGKSVELAKQTAERQLRAYVFLDGGSIRSIAADPQRSRSLIEVAMQFKNYGQTPAYKFQCWHRCVITDAGATPTYEKSTATQYPTILGPGSEEHGFARMNITNDEISAITSRKRIIHIWGGCEYVDAFDQSRYFEFFAVQGPVNERGIWPIIPAQRPSQGN